VALAPLPVVAAVWGHEAARQGGFTAIRRFFEHDADKVL
jgi:hypothetical protein